MTIGILHPGEMGAAVGATLRTGGRTVLWASNGRSEATIGRATGAGLEDVETVEELARRSEVILSICPPDAAVDVAGALRRFDGIYVDANAVSPATARTISALVGRYVDGGIVGPPPRVPGTTYLYLSGREATGVGELFAGTNVEPLVLSDDPGAASALKMVYAAWTKGSSALLLAIRAVARAEGVEEALLAQWDRSLPRLPEQCAAAARNAVGKGWRYEGEMNEVAETFASAGMPDGFHRAAAEIYRRAPRRLHDSESLEQVLSALMGGSALQ